MVRHPVFKNILLHTDLELSLILGQKITKRIQVHSWPLSVVQKVTLSNGKKVAYKSQLPPTVEPAFYQAVSSPLLAGYTYLGSSEDCEFMTIDWIDSPSLGEMISSAGELADHAKKIIAGIGEMQGNHCVYLDLGSMEGWENVGNSLVHKLKGLIAHSRFRTIVPDEVERLTNWASQVTPLVKDNSRIIHGDLKADHVFVTDDGYKVIDWQRPVIAPAEIDLVSLFVGQQIDPLPFVSTDYVRLFWFLRLHWAVVAQSDLFPDKRWPLFDNWAGEAIHHILT